MARVVVPDACVLYSAALRDLLLRFAEADLLSLRWSNRILDEVVRALARTRPDIPLERLERLKALMITAFPDAMVDPGVPFSSGLPDPNDEHVLAIVAVSSADTLVTHNVRDFPAHIVAQATPARVVSPDELFSELLQADRKAVRAAVASVVRDLRDPPIPAEAFIDKLRVQLPGFVDGL